MDRRWISTQAADEANTANGSPQSAPAVISTNRAMSTPKRDGVTEGSGRQHATLACKNKGNFSCVGPSAHEHRNQHLPRELET